MSCLPAALEALTHGGCMERASFLQDSDSQPIASLPVYVAHAGRLRRRRRFVRAQLRALGAPDVTMVLCADAEEVARLTVTQRRCLHPDYARTRCRPPRVCSYVENTPDVAGQRRRSGWLAEAGQSLG